MQQEEEPLQQELQELQSKSWTDNEQNGSGYIQELQALGADRGQQSCDKEQCRKRALASALWLGYLAVNIAYSIMIPFFAKEAKARDMTSFETGVIIGASPLFVGLTAPFVGCLLPSLGVKFTLVSGLFITGAAYTIFSFTMDMPTNPEFFGFCVLVRSLEGVGVAAYVNASYTMIAVVHGSSAPFLRTLIQLACAIGFVFSPLIGASLYTIGGFQLPFLVSGGLILFFVPIVFVLTPSIEIEKHPLPFRVLFKQIKSLVVLLIVYESMVSYGCLSFYIPTLAHFMFHEFHVPVMVTGLMYFVGQFLYTVASYIVGFLLKKVEPRWFSFLGLFIAGVGMFLVGPAYFILQHSHLWLTMAGYTLTALGSGICSVPIIPDLVAVSKENDPETSPQVLNAVGSSLISFSLSFGEFLGPAVGGGLTEVIGFRTTAVVIGELLLSEGLALIGVTIVDFIVSIVRRKNLCCQVTKEPAG